MSNMVRATITRRGANRLRGGHLWIYSDDVVELTAAQPGDEVRVVDRGGYFLGRAFFSDKSKIQLRLVRRADEPLDRDYFAERIKQAALLRRQLFGEGDRVHRLVSGESDGIPGLVVDRYGPALVIQTLIQATEQRKELLVELLTEMIQPEVIVERNDVRVRQLEGLEQRAGVISGSLDGPLEVEFAGIRAEIDPLKGQKTGTFLDQRENQLRAAELVSPGDRCLDVFTHIGGFALQMARAGGNVRAIDSSKSALEQAQHNAALNQLEPEWIKANAFDWLKAEGQSENRYNVVVLDPPAFAKSRKAIKGAERGYKDINLRGIKLLAPGGYLVSCSCSYNMSIQRLQQLVQAAASDAGVRMQLLERRGASRDHPALLGVPESDYLKCLVLRRLD